MKIGVYSKALSHSPLFGIGYYVFHLMEALRRIDAANEYLLFSDKKLLHLPKGLKENKEKSPSLAYSYLGFPNALKQHQCDLAFLPRECVPPFLKIPKVITAFDLYFLKCSKEMRKHVPLRVLLHYHLAAKIHFRRADAILAISETTKEDLIELCGVRPEVIHVTPLGVDASLFYQRSETEIQTALKKYNVKQPYFINTSSAWCARKNLLRLIQSFALLHQKSQIPHQLVITGSPRESYPAMLELIHREGLQEKVRLLKYVPRGELPVLLSGAEALVFPSFHEWYGLPILEAMASGCPVITSEAPKQSSEKRNVGIFFNPYDVDSIEAAMHTFINNPRLKTQLMIQGLEASRAFSWENTAAGTLNAFHGLT
jgi:glycosyltransferase involved in cell wall biosynthesis